MRVFLATTTSLPPEATPLAAFQAIARADKHKIHTLTNDPAEADIILIIDAHQHQDWRLCAIQNHPLTLQYRAKTLVYNERDCPW